MGLTIFSVGPNGPSKVNVRKLEEVAAEVGRLKAANHLGITVGKSKDDALPYGRWQLAAQGSDRGDGPTL